MKLSTLSFGVALLALTYGLADVAAQSPLPPLPGRLRDEVRASVDLGLRYLRWQQNPQNGSWNDDAETTALGLDAFVQSHRRYIEEDGPFIRGPIAFVANQAGAISPLSPATSSLTQRGATALALRGLKKPGYQPLVDLTVESLVSSLQQAADSGNRFDPHEIAYALSVLRAAAIPPAHPVWNRALSLLGQGEATAGSQPSGDPAVALYALLAAGVPKTDSRVQSAWSRLAAHFAPAQADESGDSTYVRYYVLVKALREYGEPVITDGRGTAHDWRAELAGALIARQHFDGYWPSNDAGGAKPNTARSTALAIAALELFYN